MVAVEYIDLIYVLNFQKMQYYFLVCQELEQDQVDVPGLFGPIHLNSLNFCGKKKCSILKCMLRMSVLGQALFSEYSNTVFSLENRRLKSNAAVAANIRLAFLFYDSQLVIQYISLFFYLNSSLNLVDRLLAVIL